MNLIPKRLKNLWEISNPKSKTSEALDRMAEALEEGKIPIEWNVNAEGDGKAEFLGEGTTEEWEDLQKEDRGEKKWYDRLKNLL